MRSGYDLGGNKSTTVINTTHNITANDECFPNLILSLCTFVYTINAGLTEER